MRVLPIEVRMKWFVFAYPNYTSRVRPQRFANDYGVPIDFDGQALVAFRQHYACKHIA